MLGFTRAGICLTIAAAILFPVLSYAAENQYYPINSSNLVAISSAANRAFHSTDTHWDYIKGTVEASDVPIRVKETNGKENYCLATFKIKGISIADDIAAHVGEDVWITNKDIKYSAFSAIENPNKIPSIGFSSAMINGKSARVQSMHVVCNEDSASSTISLVLGKEAVEKTKVLKIVTDQVFFADELNRTVNGQKNGKVLVVTGAGDTGSSGAKSAK